MDVVIYTRVSTEDQKEFGFSLQDQERRLRQYCKQHGYNILKHYQDDASGKTFKRPQFQLFFKELKEKKIKPVMFICSRYDRFSRNYLESILMMEELRKLNVKVQMVENHIENDTPESIIPLLLQLALPQVENERRAVNTKNGIRQAMRQGRWMWRAPKGYKNDTFTKTIIKTDESLFIMEAFHEVAKGVKSIDMIRRRLNEKGFICSKQQFVLCCFVVLSTKEK